MSSKLIRLRPVSASTLTPDAGPIGQKTTIPINGLTQGMGIAVDDSQRIFISDASQHVIYRYRFGDSSSHIFAGTYGVPGLQDYNPAPGTTGAAMFNSPGPICVDRRGNVWVVDAGNERIRRIDDNGRVFTVAALPAGLPGAQVGGIAVDAGENIFLIDNTA
jgi:sugar lactone lactonase YvrE